MKSYPNANAPWLFGGEQSKSFTPNGGLFLPTVEAASNLGAVVVSELGFVVSDCVL